MNSDELLTRGISLQSDGNYNEAIKCFKQILNTEPRNERAWFFLADTYTLANDFGRALASFEQVTALNPSYPMASAKVQDLKSIVQSNSQFQLIYTTEKKMLQSISRFNFG